MLASSLVLLLLQQPITFEPGVTNLEAIVKKLSETTGETLEVQGNIKNRVFGVFARSETPAEIKENLAKLNHASWQLENGKLVLRQTPEQIEEEKKLSEERLAERYQKILDALPETKLISEAEAEEFIKKIRSKRPEVNDIRGRTAFMNMLRTPVGGNVAAEVAKALGPKAFTNSGRNRIVYAYNPTKMQRPMDAKIQNALATFLKNQELLAKYSDKYPIDDSNVIYANEKYDSPKNISRLLISITNNLPNTHAISVKGYSDSGVTVVNNSVNIGFSYGQTVKAATDSKYNVPIELSEESLAAIKNVADRQNFIQPFVKYIQDSSKGDILSVINYEALKFWANKAEKSLYAAVPDSMLIAPFLVQDRNSLLAYQSVFEEFTEQHEDNKRILLEDAFPTHNDKDRYPRDLIKQSYSAISNAKTLDQRAKAFYDSYEYLDNTFWQILFAYTALAETGYYSTPEYMAFFGGLTAEQKNRLRKNQPVQFSELNKKTQGILHSLVYNANHLPLTLEVSQTETPEEMQKRFEYMQGIASEPTEILPNGLTIPITIKANVDSHEAFFGNLGGYTNVNRPLTPNDIAAHVTSQHLTSGSTTWKLPENVTYYKGQAVFWNLRVVFSNIGHIDMMFDDHTYDASKGYTKNDMPKEFWDQVYKAIEEQRAYQITQGSGGNVKP